MNNVDDRGFADDFDEDETKVKKSVQCACWDIRFGAKQENVPDDLKGKDVVYSLALERVIEPSEVCELFRELCKAWVFQVEKGENTGTIHFQARISLHKKRRFQELKDELDETVLKGATLLPTSNNGRSGQAFWSYCSKRPSKVLGPWCSKSDYEPAKMTRQLRQFYDIGLQPWMKTVQDMMAVPDERHVDMIIDFQGNRAKSVFVEHLHYKEISYDLPPLRLMSDIMEFVLSSRKQKLWKSYSLDLPRGMKKDKMGDFFSGIELLKRGKAYDRRYSAKRTCFDRPNVWVFTNALPPYGLLSKDRWRMWKISEELQLIPFYDQPQENLPALMIAEAEDA